MKAIVCPKYGPPDVLQLQEVEKPVPRAGEVLIRVRAASVNSWDWDLLRGRPYLTRVEGLRKPKHEILGADVAGQVEAVGSQAAKFRPGDAVFGDISGSGWGAFAEYVCAREDVLTHKPDGMTFEEAASVPQAGLLALQGLRYGGQIQPGQKVLLNGAGGGVGAFGIQLAKYYGAEVTGVDSAEKLDLMRSIGADHVIDYAQEDFTQGDRRYDLILDVVANRRLSHYRRVLSPEGTLVLIGGKSDVILWIALRGAWISRTSAQKVGLLLHRPNTDDLDALAEHILAGDVVPVIDSEYPLNEVPEAIRRLGAGKVKGKIVITLPGTEGSKSEV